MDCSSLPAPALHLSAPPTFLGASIAISCAADISPAGKGNLSLSWVPGWESFLSLLRGLPLGESARPQCASEHRSARCF